MRETRAAVFYEYFEPIVVESVQIDPPQPGEVLVRIAASGVCRSDLHLLKKEWTAPLPMVIGHEASGRVVEVGEGVTRVRPGDPAILSFAPNCGHCFYCVTGKGHLCSTMRRTPAGMLPGGTTRLHKNGQPIHVFGRMGSFSEYAVVHESSVIPIGPDVPLDLAALIGCSVTTGIGAVINTARVPAGSTVVVIGCGGVGLNIIQGARLVSAARIIAVDITTEKLELALRCGATDLVDARDGDPVARIREMTGDGVDFAFEALGTSATIQAAFDVARQGGTTVVAGMAPHGEMVTINGYLLASHEKTLKGSFYGSARASLDMPMLVHFAQTGKIALDPLVTRRYALDEINEAYAALDRGEPGRGLVVFDGV